MAPPSQNFAEGKYYKITKYFKFNDQNARSSNNNTDVHNENMQTTNSRSQPSRNRLRGQYFVLGGEFEPIPKKAIAELIIKYNGTVDEKITKNTQFLLEGTYVKGSRGSKSKRQMTESSIHIIAQKKKNITIIPFDQLSNFFIQKFRIDYKYLIMKDHKMMKIKIHEQESEEQNQIVQRQIQFIQNGSKQIFESYYQRIKRKKDTNYLQTQQQKRFRQIKIFQKNIKLIQKKINSNSQKYQKQMSDFFENKKNIQIRDKIEALLQNKPNFQSKVYQQAFFISNGQIEEFIFSTYLLFNRILIKKNKSQPIKKTLQSIVSVDVLKQSQKKCFTNQISNLKQSIMFLGYVIPFGIMSSATQQVKNHIINDFYRKKNSDLRSQNKFQTKQRQQLIKKIRKTVCLKTTSNIPILLNRQLPLICQQIMRHLNKKPSDFKQAIIRMDYYLIDPQLLEQIQKYYNKIISILPQIYRSLVKQYQTHSRRYYIIQRSNKLKKYQQQRITKQKKTLLSWFMLE